MKEKIMYQDEKAAKKTAISGWISANGRFFTEEHIARYDGCTHVSCEKCKEDCEKPYYVCRNCREKADNEKYLLKPFKEWDGEMLVIYGSDTYFTEEDEIVYYCEEEGVDIKDLQLVICEPVYLPELDYSDFFHDELPEDFSLADAAPDVIDAFEVLNRVIREQKPASWVEGKFRTTINI